jgi:hypothetical protein
MSEYKRVLWFALNVASVTVSVFLVDRLREPLMIENSAETGFDCVGYYDENMSVILIDWSTPPEKADADLYHEIGHAIVTLHGVSFTPGEAHSAEHEELVGNPLWMAEFDTLRRNGMLVIPPRPDRPVSL